MIAWEESGAGAPIVFVHGITEDRHTWHSVVPFLEDSFRCVRLDCEAMARHPMPTTTARSRWRATSPT